MLEISPWATDHKRRDVKWGGEITFFFYLEKFGKNRFFVKILIRVVSDVRHIERYHSTDKIHSFSEWFCFFAYSCKFPINSILKLTGGITPQKGMCQNKGGGGV